MNNALASKLAFCETYDRCGWSMTPTHGKAAYRPDWPCERLGCESMAEILAASPRDNIGVLLGEPSGWLIDIDLDHPLAVEMASDYLPSTGAIFGRAGNVRSHWLYSVTAPIATTQHRLHGTNQTIVELRSTGGQTVFPPSQHPSGEAIEWDTDGEPASIDPTELSAAVSRLADAVREKLGVTSAATPKTNGHAPQLRNHAPLDRDKILDRASKYLAKVPSAISGQGGQIAVFRAACELYRFGLTDSEARGLFDDFNSRCEPPWSEKDIDHNLSNARDEVIKSGEFGCRLLAQNNAGGKRPDGVVCDTTPENSEKIEVLSRVASVATPKTSPIEPFRAFPVDVLPEPIGEVVRRVTKAMGCDPSFVALPALSVLAGAIGNSRRIRLKHGWTEPVIIWTGIVGESGTLKSPPLEWLTQPLRDREEVALERHATVLEEFAAEQMRHAAAVAAWKQRKSVEPPPLTPVPPVCSRSFTSDTTIEAVCAMLADNPRGMILIRDELAGWVSAFDQYKSRGGSDAAHWLSIHSAKGFVVDRKTGDRKTIFVARPAMSVTGGIQPATLRRVLADGHVENGLAARLLFAYPPRLPKRWTEADISPAIETKWKTLIDGLFELQSAIDENAKRQPVVVSLTPAAKAAWITFYNEHAAEQADLSGDLAAAWSKLECYAARLALVAHCVRVVSRDPSLTSHDAVDEVSIGAGITLSRWFGHEAKRVYAMLGETEGGTEHRQLVEWIQTRGGTATARDLQRGPQRFRNATAEFADAELNKLVKAGQGVWEAIETTPVGGQPSRRFRLCDTGDTRHNPQSPEENRGTVAQQREAVA